MSPNGTLSAKTPYQTELIKSSMCSENPLLIHADGSFNSKSLSGEDYSHFNFITASVLNIAL